MGVVGSSVRRVDGEAKVTGAAVYCLDYEEPWMLHAKLLRSPEPAGRIVRLDTAAAAALPGVRVVVTAADAAGPSGLFVKDQPLFAGEAVRYAGEPVAAVAADSLDTAEAALAAIELEIEPEDPVADPDAAIAPGAPLVHPEWERYACALEGERDGNIAWMPALACGDVDREFARDDVVIVEDAFETARQHQSYIEPRCAVARFEGGRCVIHASTQFPHLVRDRVAEALELRPSHVRVLANTVGGGFGGKLDAGPELYAALLARRARRPVKLVYTRGEEFVAGTMRENGSVRIRTAATRDGTLVAQEASVLMDAGAYAGETPAIAAVAMLILPGTYRIPNVRYGIRAVYTNTPPTGAFRGICGPYLVFAVERHMDNLAAALGVDRRELRLRHVYRDGDHFPTGQEIPDSAFADAFDRVEQVAPWRSVSERRPWHGVGIVATSWLTNPLAGSATVKLNEDGTVGLVTAATDIGTGAVATGVVQILAEVLGIAPEDVIVHPPDTDAAAFDGGAQGSRTVFNVGNAVRRASADLREQVLEHAADLIEAARDDLVIEDGSVLVRGAPQARVSLGEVAVAALERGGPLTASRSAVSAPVPVDPRAMTGAFFTHLNAPTFHVHLAEVEVDPATGQVEIMRYVVAQDVGRAINPSAIEGQIHGGVAQGIGYALYENIHLDGGHVLEHDLEGYRLPGPADVPRIETLLLEHPHPDGPFGAKGVGEPPVVPVAAAIANAVADAIGRPIDRLPITPFDVLAAIHDGGAGHVEDHA